MGVCEAAERIVPPGIKSPQGLGVVLLLVGDHCGSSHRRYAGARHPVLRLGAHGALVELPVAHTLVPGRVARAAGPLSLLCGIRGGLDAEAEHGTCRRRAVRHRDGRASVKARCGAGPMARARAERALRLLAAAWACGLTHTPTGLTPKRGRPSGYPRRH
mgnify:CR=1 FL=1